MSTPRKYMSVFMINSGMVTGYGPEGQRVFATATQSSWSEDEVRTHLHARCSMQVDVHTDWVCVMCAMVRETTRASMRMVPLFDGYRFSRLCHHTG